MNTLPLSSQTRTRLFIGAVLIGSQASCHREEMEEPGSPRGERGVRTLPAPGDNRSVSREPDPKTGGN
jgi:hypothetical protein